MNDIPKRPWKMKQIETAQWADDPLPHWKFYTGTVWEKDLYQFAFLKAPKEIAEFILDAINVKEKK